MLVEIAREQDGYTPDLSFGTHFFQDLVEASIRYLPIYPDDREVLFNEAFLTRNKNILAELLPDYASYADCVYVVDVPKTTGGQVLRVLMNADLEQAIGYLDDPSTEMPEAPEICVPSQRGGEGHWEWRQRMADRIAADLDPAEFGVKALYIFGSTKNWSAGPSSDIDLLVHIDSTEQQRACLESWFRGWGVSLAEMNFLRTGYQSDNLLDIHYVTDEDIEKRNSYASKINAVTDAARLLSRRGTNG